MRTRPPVRPVAHWSPARRRTWRAWRFVRRFAWYWTRMSLVGAASGIMIAGLFNQASVSHFDYPKPTPAGTHAAP